MEDEIVEILGKISKKTKYSYTTLSSVNYRITKFFPHISIEEKVNLLSSIIELNKFVIKENNEVICINGYQLNIAMYVILSDILIKKHKEKNKKTEEILDEYLNERKDFLKITPKLNDMLKKELMLSNYVISSCFNHLKKDHKDLNYKETIRMLTFLLELKGKFKFIPNKNVVKIKNDFYSLNKVSFLDNLINIKLNNKEANSDEIINIYENIYKYNKILIGEERVDAIPVETIKLTKLEKQISDSFSYSSNFFKKLFNMLKCRNSSITDDDYISCLNMVIDLSSDVNYDNSKRYKVVIEKFNYEYNVSTFWIMLFELKLGNPSMILDDAVLKVVEQTGGNPYFSDDGKSSKDNGISIIKKG